MALLVIPYTFSPDTTIYSSQVNANFAAVQTAIADIDNTNIGAAGIYASQIIPLSTAEATFGGSESYIFPTTIQTQGGQTNVAGTSIQIPGDNGSGNATLIGANASASVSGIAGAILSLFSSGTGPGSVLSVSALGDLGVLRYLAANSGYVPPVYTANGSQTSAGLHMVYGTTAATTGGTAVTLSGKAAFTSGSTFVVFLGLALASEAAGVAINSGTGFTITTASSNFNVNWLAIGY